jgi:molybdenum cofactor cytidylyltransferase
MRTKTDGVWGVLLAAGESRRMEQLKQLLPYGNVTIVEAVARTLLGSGLDGVLVVLGHEAEQVRSAVGHLPVHFAVNEEYREGMLASIQCAVRVLPGAEAICVALVDQPAVTSDVVRTLAQRFASSGRGMAVPVYEGKRGHPVVVGLRRYREEILALPRDVGLRALMHAHPEDILEVPVATDAVLRDLDYPEEYEREISRNT